MLRVYLTLCSPRTNSRGIVSGGGSEGLLHKLRTADNEWMHWLAFILENAGYTSIIQDNDFDKNFTQTIDSYINRARRSIVLLSPDYLNSILFPSEWATAFSRDPTGAEDLLVDLV